MKALIFLYEIKEQHKEVIYQQNDQTPQEEKMKLLQDENPFFIIQKISNACGTIALLHALCN